MRFFFKSRQFKTAAIITAVVLAISIFARIIGGVMSPQSNLLGAVVSPFQKIITSASNGIQDFFQKFRSSESLILENAKLTEQINDLNEKIADYDQMKNQNDFYKDYLGIKEVNPDFEFCDAVLISRDTTDTFEGFTIDRGSIHGIELYDPVITDAGLVGYVTNVGLTTSKVTTILDPEISVAAIASRTGDAGYISGNINSVAKGFTKLNNLQRTAAVAVGDYVITAGGGIFPEGLLIGKISVISQEEYTSVLYAEIEPFVNISEIRRVMVITDFTGRSVIDVSGGAATNE